MKKKVTSALNTSNDYITERFIEMLDDEMYHVGYEVTGQGIFPNLTIQVSYVKEDPEMMPNISFAINEFEPGLFEIIPSLAFPRLTVNEGDYYDTIHYWVSKWEDVASRISTINKISFAPEDYIDEE